MGALDSTRYQGPQHRLAVSGQDQVSHQGSERGGFRSVLVEVAAGV